MITPLAYPGHCHQYGTPWKCAPLSHISSIPPHGVPLSAFPSSSLPLMVCSGWGVLCYGYAHSEILQWALLNEEPHRNCMAGGGAPTPVYCSQGPKNIFKKDLVNYRIQVIVCGREPFIKHISKVLHQDARPPFLTCLECSEG